jgi:two-component system chemotaxis sensor kinase CheA
MEPIEQRKLHEPRIGLKEIQENYMKDFIQEILETLDSIELELVNLEVDPGNAEYLNAVYCDFHTIKGLTGFLEDDLASRITEQTETLIEACRKFNITTTRTIINILLQTILFLRRLCNNQQLAHETKFQGEVEQHLVNIRQFQDEIMLEVKQPVKPPEYRIGEILIEEGAIKEKDVEEVLIKQNSIYKKMKFGEIAMREKKVDAGELIKAIRAQKIRNECNEQFVRIPIKRLDEILDIVVQLANIQNDLHHESVLRFGSNDAFSVELNRAENMFMDIRKIIGELRMVPLKQSFQKLSRAVKAMIEDAGLHVVFSTVGESTELSKEIADDIIVPLAEIVECMLSGFASGSENEKNKLGNIEVVAYKKDNTVIIEINNSKMPAVPDRSKKFEQVQAKIKKLNGRLEYEELDDDGCKVKIILLP